MKAWHSPTTGTLHLSQGKWFKMSVFAAPADPTINDGLPCLEVAVRIRRWWKVFHFNLTPALATNQVNPNFVKEQP